MAAERSGPLYLLAAAAVAVGVYARFKGLGAAPLAIDEYYLVRSADNVLHSGLPQFDCGGLYTRGLILQYLIAGLRALGLSAEVAPRLITAASSLIALPAAYILGRRVYGRTVGLLAVTILAVSVWEVEMARFGRMYAPFQAVFLWYLVFFLRYTVDREARALWAMLGLTLLGSLTWEGSVFMAVANLLPVILGTPSGRLTRRDYVYLAGCVALLVLVYAFVTGDFRYTNDPPWPPGYDSVTTIEPQDPLEALADPLTVLPDHIGWLILLLVPGAFGLLALRWIWKRYGPSLASAGLAAALVAALLHQFVVVVAAVLLVLLLRMVSPREVFSRAAGPFHACIVSSGLFWVAFSFSVATSLGDYAGSPVREALVLLHHLVGFPDVVDVVVRPWAAAVPILGAALLLLLAAALARLAMQEAPTLTAERALAVLFVCLLLAVGASNPPRHETRYVYFLYPVALVLTLSFLADASRAAAARWHYAAAAIPAVALAAFLFSEDFDWAHLARIDSSDVVFRKNASAGEASHLVIRDDTRAMARWLQENAAGPGSVVVSGYHSLEYYFPKIDYMFVDWHDHNFPELSCRAGTVDRWSNLPLLYTPEALEAKLPVDRNVYVVMFSNRVDNLVTNLHGWSSRVAWTDEWVSIVALKWGGRRGDARVTQQP